MIDPRIQVAPERIFLIHSDDHTGHRAYYFLHVPALKQPLFEDALKRRGDLNLKKYGDILVSGYGDAPADVRQLISQKYGWKE